MIINKHINFYDDKNILENKNIKIILNYDEEMDSKKYNLQIFDRLSLNNSNIYFDKDDNLEIYADENTENLYSIGEYLFCMYKYKNKTFENIQLILNKMKENKIIKNEMTKLKKLNKVKKNIVDLYMNKDIDCLLEIKDLLNKLKI